MVGNGTVIPLHHARVQESFVILKRFFDYAEKNFSLVEVKDAIVPAIKRLHLSISKMTRLSKTSNSKIPKEEEQKRNSAKIILASLCESLDISCDRAEHAYLALFGDVLPFRAPVRWSDRPVADEEMTPIQFYEKYWKSYADKGLLYQVDLRSLDGSLFEAIKIYVRRHLREHDLKDYLPPPNESRFARHSVHRPIDLMESLESNSEVAETVPQRKSRLSGSSNKRAPHPR